MSVKLTEIIIVTSTEILKLIRNQLTQLIF